MTPQREPAPDEGRQSTMAVREPDMHPAFSHLAVRLQAGDAGALAELYDAMGRRAFSLARACARRPRRG
ncbi:MAG: hypothetical protein WCQ48_06840 [Chloroflexota bacterium]